MTDDQATDPLRARLHAMWSSVAEPWAAYADEVDERAAGLTARMLDRAAVGAGDHVLELACGPGGLGLAAAGRVGPGGRVVLSDVAAEMAATAAARAVERGLTNVEARALDIEDIAEPDEQYDVVLCREGLMFAVDVDRAAREIHRVMRPGARLAVAVWGPREQNPWLGLVLDAVSEQVGAPVPPPGIPHPFALSDADQLTTVLSNAGLTDVEIERVDVPLRSPSFEHWWARTTAVAGPIAAVVAGMPDDAKTAITDRVRAAVEPYRTESGLDLPGVSLLAWARRP